MIAFNCNHKLIRICASPQYLHKMTHHFQSNDISEYRLHRDAHYQWLLIKLHVVLTILVPKSSFCKASLFCRNQLKSFIDNLAKSRSRSTSTIDLLCFISAKCIELLSLTIHLWQHHHHEGSLELEISQSSSSNSSPAQSPPLKNIKCAITEMFPGV
jgi:hypothetical protein